MAVLALLRPWRAGCEHGRLPGGAGVGCRRLGRAHGVSTGAASRASERSPCRRRTDDRGVRASCATAQQGRRACSARRRGGGRPAAASAVAPTDVAWSRCEGTAAESEEAAHRRQAAAPATRRLSQAQARAGPPPRRRYSARADAVGRLADRPGDQLRRVEPAVDSPTRRSSRSNAQVIPYPFTRNRPRTSVEPCPHPQPTHGPLTPLGSSAFWRAIERSPWTRRSG